MEKNTFSVSAYIDSSMDAVFDYLSDLQTLNEWTLFSRMREKVDADTWIGTASGYQRDLYYHIRRCDGGVFKGVEWHCGFEYGNYFQVYPTFLFPPSYIEPGSTESGVYFHWVSFVDPARRTPMIEQCIGIAHTAECRSLKSVLERKAGRTQWTQGKYAVKTATIYVDAPLEMGAAYMADVQQMPEWAHLLRLQTARGQHEGDFHDEYDQHVTISTKTHTTPSYVLIEHDSVYRDHDLVRRAPAILMPCSYALGNPDARGFMLQRITFWNIDAPPRRGHVQLADYCAELINAKRILEGRAGKRETFALGPSYLPPQQQSAQGGHGAA